MRQVGTLGSNKYFYDLDGGDVVIDVYLSMNPWISKYQICTVSLYVNHISINWLKIFLKQEPRKGLDGFWFCFTFLPRLL